MKFYIKEWTFRAKLVPFRLKSRKYVSRGKLTEEPLILTAAVRGDGLGAKTAVGCRVVEVDVHLAVVEEHEDEDEDGEEEDVNHNDPVDPTTSKPFLRSNLIDPKS